MAHMKVSARRQAHGGDKLVELVLKAAVKPLSTYEIRDRIVAGGDRISVPQVYRIVARLVAMARIRRVETLNAYIVGAAREDAIAICRNCLSAMPVPNSDLVEQVFALMRRHGFAAEDVIIEARGQCDRCRPSRL